MCMPLLARTMHDHQSPCTFTLNTISLCATACVPARNALDASKVGNDHRWRVLSRMVTWNVFIASRLLSVRFTFDIHVQRHPNSSAMSRDYWFSLDCHAISPLAYGCAEADSNTRKSSTVTGFAIHQHSEASNKFILRGAKNHGYLAYGKLLRISKTGEPARCPHIWIVASPRTRSM